MCACVCACAGLKSLLNGKVGNKLTSVAVIKAFQGNKEVMPRTAKARLVSMYLSRGSLRVLSCSDSRFVVSFDVDTVDCGIASWASLPN